MRNYNSAGNLDNSPRNIAAFKFSAKAQKMSEDISDTENSLPGTPSPSSFQPWKPLLSIIATQLKRLTGYQAMAVLAVDAGRLILLNAAEPPQSFKLPNFKVFQETLQYQQPVVLNRIAADVELFDWLAALATYLPDEDSIMGTAGSLLSLPLVINNTATGLLLLAHRQQGYFTVRHAWFGEVILRQASQAHQRLYQQAQASAVQGERQRMARELHDSINQVFYGSGLNTNILRKLLKAGEEETTTPYIEEILQLVDAGMTEMRALVLELHPEFLQSEGLIASLQKRLAVLRVRYGIEVTENMGKEPDVTPAIKEALFRVSQEALHNIVKHAQADQVQIYLRSDFDKVRLEISDNGKGFNPAQKFPGHLGLVSMHERITALNGTLQIESSPGKGTRLIATIPFHFLVQLNL